MEIKGIIIKSLLEDIKTTPIDSNATYFLIGRDTLGDGKGGFYYWDASSTEAEEMAYMSVIKSNLVEIGRFKRVFSRAIPLPHGVLTISGGVRTFYTTIPHMTNTSGECTFNLTLDNTTTGPAIFTEIWWNQSRAIPPATSSLSVNDIIKGDCKSQSANLKTTTHIFSRGAEYSGITLTSILSLVIKGLRIAPQNTQVQVRIEGI